MSLPLFPDAPPVDPSREGWTEPPFQPASHASYTGSRVAVETWSERQSAILQLLRGGDKTRQELAGLSGYPLASVCSAVGALLKQGEIERTGEYDTAVFASGETKRERLRIRR